MKIKIYTQNHLVMVVSATQTLSVDQAKAQLRVARLAQHKQNITRAIQSGNDEKLSVACSGFVALYRSNKNKKKPSD